MTEDLLTIPFPPRDAAEPVRLLLLDDDPSTLFLRSIILRQHGYECIAVSTTEEAIKCFTDIDIAVLDYHLGAGEFGTNVAATLRQLHPNVPIIILSATLEYCFGGVEDMHLLKGYSSNEDLVTALKSLEAKRRGGPVFVDAWEFFYSRIALAIGADVLIQILDAEGNWIYCNEAAADFLGHERTWFRGLNLFRDAPMAMRDWRDIVRSVATSRDTYIDRSRHGLLSSHPSPDTIESLSPWSVLAFPLTLHDGRSGVALTARVLGNSVGLTA